MAIYSICKKRESLTFKSEIYKSLVRKYLETMGFSQLTDSYVEGHLSDMIFVNPDISLEKYFYVEAKATSLSPNDKKFSSELLNYLVEWLILPDSDKFELYIFIMKLKNKKEFEKLFGSKSSQKNIKSWIDKHIANLHEEQQKIIKNTSLKDILRFFSKIIIYEADIEGLKNAIEEKDKISLLSIKRYAKSLLSDIQRRGKPIQKKSQLISNLVSFEPPNEFYVAKSKYKNKKRIYNYFDAIGLEIPPFLLYPENQKIYTFCPFDEFNPLNEIIEGKSYKVDFNDKNINIQFKISLINIHLRRIFWKKGLRRVPNTNIYFFECYEKDGVFQKRYCQKANGELKVVSRPYYKEDEDGNKKLNFIFHHAAEISPKFYWEKYYIQIIPKRIYTLDGFTPIEGKSKDIIDRKFRNPLYNRSQNKLTEIRFWEYYLFRSLEYEKIPEEWFKKFKFESLQTFSFDWVPETIERGQSLLEEFTYEKHPNP